MREVAVEAGRQKTEARADARPRRALVCAGPSVASMLERQLRQAGYAVASEVGAVADAETARAVAQFEPHVVIFALHNVSDNERLALARRLRSEAATHALPLVFLHHSDARQQRAAVLALGADDYVPLATPPAELCARLEALFWRAEAGRRAAPVAGERSAEIDNFMLLLDAVRADAREGARPGALALVEAAPGEAGADGRRALAEAYGHLKLNLRRADSVAFYGPDALFVYAPGRTADDLRATLARLRAEFASVARGADFAAGVVSFPAHGVEVESLIEMAASAAADAARAANGDERIAVYAPGAGEQRAIVTEAAARVREDESPAETESVAPAQAEELRIAAPGRVEVDDKRMPDGGARTRNADATEEWTARAAEAGARELERRARGEVMPRRLLLAVSDPLRMSRLNLLARAAGYTVRAAFDGHQALNLLRIERPDLLVLDGVLNDMEGVEALHRLNRQTAGGRTRLPVVLLADAARTGDGDELSREAAQAGARAVVSLSSDPFDFLAVIRRAGGVE